MAGFDGVFGTGGKRETVDIPAASLAMSEMALSIVKGLLQQYLQSLCDEGIVNAQFSHIQTLKVREEPDAVVQLINTYCIDVEEMLFELGSYIDHPVVDFSKLAALAQQVEERSSRIGAEHMRLACADLIEACRQMHKRKFSVALNWLKNEFAHIRTKLQVFVQMERKITRLENKQQK